MEAGKISWSIDIWGVAGRGAGGGGGISGGDTW